MAALEECLTRPEEFQAFDGLINQYVAQEGGPVSVLAIQQYTEATYNHDFQHLRPRRILEKSVQAGFVVRPPMISAHMSLYLPKLRGIEAFRAELFGRLEYVRDYVGLLSIKSVGFEFFDERLELADKAQGLLLDINPSTPGPQL